MNEMGSALTFQFSEEKPKRLDVALSEWFLKSEDFSYITRSQIKNWIKAGLISVNQSIAKKAGYLLEMGDKIEIQTEVISASEITSWNYSLDVVYEDQSILVVNKPAGVSSHPGSGNRTKTLVNALYAHLGENFGDLDITHGRPGIVHRLDKDTTGLLVIAKNKRSLSNLSAQFHERSVGRRYDALVLCMPRGKRAVNLNDSGIIDRPVGRHPTKKVQMAVFDSGQGRKAETHWNVAERMKYAALLEVRLKTGRTHQIRVHMDSEGMPIIGDKTYGNFSSLPKPLRDAAVRFGRQALHAGNLSFDHPISGKRLNFDSEIPADFRDLIEHFRKYSS
jgi:23S rRNA pseudouridine1911/1915/1917 synthase